MKSPSGAQPGALASRQGLHYTLKISGGNGYTRRNAA